MVCVFIHYNRFSSNVLGVAGKISVSIIHIFCLFNTWCTWPSCPCSDCHACHLCHTSTTSCGIFALLLCPP